MNIVRRLTCLVVLMCCICGGGFAAEIIPPLPRIQPDHPRLLLRPGRSSAAVSLESLRAEELDEASRKMLRQLRGEKSAAAQAMVWLLTRDEQAARRAIDSLRSYRFPGDVDTFHTYFKLTEMALAYDWLHRCDTFKPSLRAEVRSSVRPLALHGLKTADDHIFHNYIWMSAGGVALWAMATAGEDAESDQLFESIRRRFNTGLFPAWKYLDGLPSEPMGYWSLYVLSPGALTLLATQSAFETNCFALIRRSDGDWLNRHFHNLIHSTLPDLRYIPWGDLQGGLNGGVTHDMAGIIDALTWATGSRQGAFFSAWLADKRGLSRFRADTALFYFLYGRQPRVAPAPPPLSFLAGNRASGHFIARSGWDDGATIVTLRATDHFGDHHHYDQGSFTIYRNGLLAVDPPIYPVIRGPQQPTEVHNTLLFGGQPQRPVRGQWFKTVESFHQNLAQGRKLETGDMLFSKDAGSWAAASCEFAQAYAPTQVRSCVRQLLFVRPDRIVVVDRITAPSNAPLPEVTWMLQLPQPPSVDGNTLWATNGKSWLLCQPLLPGAGSRSIESTPARTHRVNLRYQGGSALILAHSLTVGDGPQAAQPGVIATWETPQGLELGLDGSTFLFSNRPPYGVATLPKSNR